MFIILELIIYNSVTALFFILDVVGQHAPKDLCLLPDCLFPGNLETCNDFTF